MSQFMLIERGVDTSGLPAVILRPIDSGEDFLVAAAMHHFGDSRECRLVTDAAGSGESLIDDLCDVQRDGNTIEETTFVQFLKAAVASGVQFVIWHGGDYRDLPTAHSWSDILDLLRNQTRVQPADVYLRFVRPTATSA